MKTRILLLTVSTLFWIGGVSFVLPSNNSGRDNNSKSDHPFSPGARTSDLAPCQQIRALPPDSWKSVDSLIKLGQPRSALDIVNKIYTEARRENDTQQYLKAVLYRIRINSEFQEDFIIQTVHELRDELSGSREPATSVLHSILADVYYKYYRNNQYRFRDRSRLSVINSDSITTWDLNTITEAITNEYLRSIQNSTLLKSVPIESVKAILESSADENQPNPGKRTKKSSRTAEVCPTLYDFLCNRALDFFSNSQGPQNQPPQWFSIDRPEFFGSSAAFSNLLNGPVAFPIRPLSYDSISTTEISFRIFQLLVDFHRNDKNPAALVTIELKRLAYVHDNAVFPSDSIYLEGLKKLEQSHIHSPWSTAVSFAAASVLYEWGQRYQPLQSADHKWDIKAARELCESAITRFPDSDGAGNCRQLSDNIREPLLHLISEQAVPPEKTSLVKVEIKNIRELYFRLVQADPEVYAEKADRIGRKEFMKYLNQYPVKQAWKQTIPSDGDFQKHSVTLAVPPVLPGYYVLLCASEESFSIEKGTLTYTPFWSTRISFISNKNDDGSMDCIILDRETGLPMKHVKAEAWERRYNYSKQEPVKVKLAEFFTDDHGMFRFVAPALNNRSSGDFFRFSFKDDLMITDNFFLYRNKPAEERSHLQTLFYTDRAIYRPGQNCYFKGIILERTGDQTKIKPGQSTKVQFNDANGQKIAEQHFITNEFGSFNGSFSIPVGRLTGLMNIYNESGSISVSVEEYKRPTFEVILNQPEGNYKLNEKLTVTGKALGFAGNAIDGGMVQFRVVRSIRFPYRDWGWFCPVTTSPETEISHGILKTGSDGSFSIEFTAVPDPATEKTTRPVFDFTITTDVTDLNGETQSVQQVVSVGYGSLLLNHNLKDIVNLHRDSLLKITTTNLNGRPTSSKVTVKISKLRQPDRAFKPRKWEQCDLNIMTREEFQSRFPYDIYANENDPSTWPVDKPVFEKTMTTPGDSVFKFNGVESRMLDQGTYAIAMIATDPFGEKIEIKNYFTAFNPDSREVPEQSLNWFVPLKTMGIPGENARFMIGSKEDLVNVMYEVRFRDSVVLRDWFKINDRATVVEVPIREQYRGNFSVNFTFVKHNRVFQNSQLVVVPYSDKNLDIRFETFRNRLDPGSHETWKIKISDSRHLPVKAEFLAAMYDASLDQFRSAPWSFHIYQRYNGLYPWEIHDGFGIESGRSLGSPRAGGSFSSIPEWQLNWFGLSYFGNAGRDRFYRVGKVSFVAPMIMDMTASSGRENEAPPPPEALAEKIASLPAPDPEKEGSDSGLAGKSSPQPVENFRIRKNFNETAFFYPALVTDSTGSLLLSFTVPESLTRWKLSGLAHTKNLEYGLIDKEVITQKDLMVFPNVPRFVRQGDTIVFSTKIVNLSDQDLAGEAVLELTNALTGQKMDSIIQSLTGTLIQYNRESGAGNRHITLSKNQSIQVSWTLAIPVGADLSLLQYRISARTGSFSDGEERAIPVLTNRMLVTESLPLPVRGKTSAVFVMDKLTGSGKTTDNSLKNYRLTLEFATNPIWYAIQALPPLNERQYQNADAIFNAFYSNSIAAFIANSNPSIKNVFESWKNATPDALQSNLEKNEELKSALLQETPWVVEALSESAQKRALGLYFDENNLNANLQKNLQLLEKLQQSSGGWTWFEGMPESRWITQNIITGLGHLDHLGITEIRRDPAIWNMVTKGIGFLDRKIAEDFQNLKNIDKINLDDDHLSVTQIQYLYARSYFLNGSGLEMRSQTSEIREAFYYFKEQAEKYWTKNDRYIQGMIALALHRMDQKEIPGLIVKSLNEKSLHSTEMGMYWAGNREQDWYRWYEAPVETQAMMIEVFDEISRDEKIVEELKIWLLKQKQTQLWRTDRATVEACYALLLRGTDWLGSSSLGKENQEGITITVGKQKIDPEKLQDIKKEAGTGYFKMSWQGSEIRPEMGQVKVIKSSDGIAWGALYWQYFEDLDKITPAKTPLKLEKKLFVEKLTPSGPVLLEIQMSKNSDSVNHAINIGDKLVVRIVLTSDRDLEFVHMKDLRASACEPVTVMKTSYPGMPGSGKTVIHKNSGSLSGYRNQDGLGYYQSTTDLATNFFFEYLPRGNYVFEYELRVNAAGVYSNGITTAQCLYAPEYSAHSEGIRIWVK